MTDEVKFTNEQWDALAEAAEVFAETLYAEKQKLRGVLATNWAGACAEGEGTFENLRTLLHDGPDSFIGSMDSEMLYLRSIAANCVNAKQGLTATDNFSAADQER